MRAIDKIKNVDNSVIKSLVAINDGTTSGVDYSTTVFQSYEGFVKSFRLIEGQMIGSQKKAMVDTPLIAEQGNDMKLYTAAKDKGVGTGLIFIDYRSKDPKLVVVVDGGSYSSASLDKDGTWKNRTIPMTFSTLDEMLAVVVTELSVDVNSFK